MKIEKLTEDKIRVIINSDEIKESSLDFHTMMTKTLKTQGLFLDILKRAEKEVDFHTDGYKLLVEAFSSHDDFWIFMITKYKESPSPKKKLMVKKSNSFNFDYNKIYDFADFETFCGFCSFLNKIHSFDCKKFCKNISLYFYNDVYYLVLSHVNEQYAYKDVFFSSIAEFAKIVKHSKNFESKLTEHGKLLIKKNAILVGMQYFI